MMDGGIPPSIMPWTTRTMIEQKTEFVSFALQEGSNISELSRRYGISRKCAYALLKRYQQEGKSAFLPRSRAPHHHPNKTPADIEALILSTRQEYPMWAARKIRRVLINEGHTRLPSVSTITAIFERHGLPKLSERSTPAGWQRYERSEPNDLWQMDFKGHVGIRNRRSNPLTILDDHSRFCVCLADCLDQTGSTVKRALTQAFICYGLPWTILCDNAPP